MNQRSLKIQEEPEQINQSNQSKKIEVEEDLYADGTKEEQFPITKKTKVDGDHHETQQEQPADQSNQQCEPQKEDVPAKSAEEQQQDFENYFKESILKDANTYQIKNILKYAFGTRADNKQLRSTCKGIFQVMKDQLKYYMFPRNFKLQMQCNPSDMLYQSVIHDQQLLGKTSKVVTLTCNIKSSATGKTESGGSYVFLHPYDDYDATKPETGFTIGINTKEPQVHNVNLSVTENERILDEFNNQSVIGVFVTAFAETNVDVTQGEFHVEYI